MSDEKMQEEFEAWAFQCAWLGLSDECMVRDEINGGYYGLELHAAWLAWEASRAALVIELPKAVGFEGAYDSLQDHEFCPRMSDVEDADEVFSLCRTIEVREAIEAVGLKVSP